ncbi:MAG: hypothetical protein K9N23_20315 [Akkermansiaceae bacterium]|nr:hypothetical protein [Akkermansiaceae bacterium]MCF7734039.1 hypothetical protein [Akkermansiaceae bacterium]
MPGPLLAPSGDKLPPSSTAAAYLRKKFGVADGRDRSRVHLRLPPPYFLIIRARRQA